MTTPTPHTVRAAIGIDIGGTKILSALVPSILKDEDDLKAAERVATPMDGTAFLDTLVRMVQNIQAESTGQPIDGVGISTAGTVNTETGTVMGSTGNLPFLMSIANLKERLEDRLGMPVMVENDANAAAYGEYCVGAGRDADHLLMITLGTGVGGGFVRYGQIYHGAHYSGMEVGHICIQREQQRFCTSGRYGSWESFASGLGARQTIHEVLKTHPEAAQSQLMQLGKAMEDITTHDLVTVWKNGDALAKTIMDIWHQDIALGLSSIINVLDPDRVVVGGGMGKFVDMAQLQTLTDKRCVRPGTPLVPAALGNSAGLVGAAFLTMQPRQVEHHALAVTH